MNALVKRLCLVLAALSAASALAGCERTTDQPSDGTAAQAQTAQTAAAPDTSQLLPDLPDYDAGGAVYMVLTKMENDEEGQWTARDILVEAQNGEVVNDAVYLRDQKIDETYNCVISQTRMKIGEQYSYTMYKEISKLVYAGDSSYDLIMPTIQDSACLARDGMLYDLNATQYIDLSKPWWNARFTSDTAIGGKNYFADGDICMTFMRAVYAILFNKQAITDYSLEDPYGLVRSGGWNIDKLMEMGAVFTSDLNGDGVIDDSDKNGLLVLNNQIEALYTASGEKFVTADASGNFTFNGDSERSLAVLEQIYKLYEDRAVTLCCTDQSRLCAENKSLGHVLVAANAFAAGRALFLLGTMNNVPRMRDMETDFGILPLPKATEDQSDYYSYVQTWASGCAAIYITAPDLKKSAIICEAMAAGAREYLTPAYYDTALKTKYARDDDSSAMLDLIYGARTCDLGNLFNIGNLVSGITNLIYKSHKDTFASFIESKRDAVDATLEELSELYKK